MFLTWIITNAQYTLLWINDSPAVWCVVYLYVTNLVRVLALLLWKLAYVLIDWAICICCTLRIYLHVSQSCHHIRPITYFHLQPTKYGILYQFTWSQYSHKGHKLKFADNCNSRQLSHRENRYVVASFVTIRLQKSIRSHYIESVCLMVVINAKAWHRKRMKQCKVFGKRLHLKMSCAASLNMAGSNRCRGVILIASWHQRIFVWTHIF